MSNPSEATIERYLVAQCKARGWRALKLVDIGRAGHPDRTVMCNGGYVWLCEVKKLGGILSKLQALRVEQFRRMGFAVFVVWSKEDVDEAICDMAAKIIPQC